MLRHILTIPLRFSAVSLKVNTGLVVAPFHPAVCLSVTLMGNAGPGM
jgi:hypothetical protein